MSNICYVPTYLIVAGSAAVSIRKFIPQEPISGCEIFVHGLQSLLENCVSLYIFLWEIPSCNTLLCHCMLTCLDTPIGLLSVVFI